MEVKDIKAMVLSCVNEFTGLEKLTDTELHQLSLSLAPLVCNKAYEERNERVNQVHLDTIFKLAHLNKVDYDKAMKLLDYQINVKS